VKNIQAIRIKDFFDDHRAPAHYAPFIAMVPGSPTSPFLHDAQKSSQAAGITFIFCVNASIFARLLMHGIR
jgi:hypothetical protein